MTYGNLQRKTLYLWMSLYSMRKLAGVITPTLQLAMKLIIELIFSAEGYGASVQ